MVRTRIVSPRRHRSAHNPLILWTFGLACALTACDHGATAETTTDARTADGDAADFRPADGDTADLGRDDGGEPDASEPDAGEPDAEVPDPPDRAPLFVEGCPRPGKASARQIDSPDFKVEGPDAIGGPGDFLLMNTKAAFVITGTGPVKTYFYYPGILVDAVPLDGCRQLAPDRFDEIGWLAGRLVPNDFARSILRALEGTEFEVVNDGADGGEARVRVHARDNIQWLVEMELIKSAFTGGGVRPLSETLGVDFTIDYVLPPDSPVLRVEVTLTNTLGTPVRVLDAAMTLFGDTAPTTFFHDVSADVGGFSLRTGLPWIVSRAGDGAWAVARANANLATANIAGVDALLDFNTAINPPALQPAGTEGDQRTTTWFVAVSDRDLNHAVAPLHDLNPLGLRRQPYMLGELAGQVVDASTGAGVPGAVVTVELENRNGDWAPIDELRADAEGRFAGLVPDVGTPLRLSAAAPGRAADTAPTDFDPAAPEPARLTLSPAGSLSLAVRDEADRALPAKVDLWREGRLAFSFSSLGDGRFDVPPGDYDLSVSRGFEYPIHRQALTVAPAVETAVAATLPRLIDTAGYLSADAHMHAGPSPDSRVLVAERIAGSAAVGLQVAIGTDHEIVRDWNEGVRDTGLGEWIVAVGGQEVTANLPEHINAYPLNPLPRAEQFRGGPVPWYGLALGEIFGAIRERGAGVVQLNHPRLGCSYLCLIDYDRLTGLPRLADPTALSFAPNAELWSWDFDAVELLNGLRSPFLDPERPKNTGIFDDWQSFLNLGHRVTATGVTDVHGTDVGSPRMYIGFDGTSLADFVPDDLTAAIHTGRVLISAGAFARIEARGAGGATAGMGELVAADDGVVQLQVRIEALPEIDVTRILVFSNCDLVAEVPATDPDAALKFEGEIGVMVGQDAHLTVVAFGERPMPPEFRDYDPSGTPRLITNAFYVDADGDGVWTPPGGKACDYAL